MDKIRVEIGGIGFLFRYDNAQIKERQDSSLCIKDFIRPCSNDFTIDIKAGNIPKYPKDKLLFQSKENWRLYGDDGEFIFETYHSPLKITRVVMMKQNSSKAVAYISPDADAIDNGTADTCAEHISSSSLKGIFFWSLENLMAVAGQLITLSILHRYQGVCIHSAGIAYKRKGIIFPGKSGSGKTTLSKLFHNRGVAAVLSDDRVIARKEKNGYFIYGTPWPGEGNISFPAKAQLKAFFFLEKSRRNNLRPLEKKEALRLLLTKLIPAIWDRESIDFSLNFCAEITRDIPCFSFGFVPDESAVEFIENGYPYR